MFETIKKTLEERDREITSRIQKIGADKKRSKGPLNADSSEQVVELENNEVLDGIDDISRHELSEIRSALTKMANGTYGVCEDCDDQIPLKRLEALPYAIRCIACEEKSEKAGA